MSGTAPIDRFQVWHLISLSGTAYSMKQKHFFILTCLIACCVYALSSGKTDITNDALSLNCCRNKNTCHKHPFPLRQVTATLSKGATNILNGSIPNTSRKASYEFITSKLSASILTRQCRSEE